MPPKRNYKKSYKRALTKKYGPPKRVIPAVRTLQAAVRRAVAKQVNKNIETKNALITYPDGSEIFHNNFLTLTNQLLSTTQGIQDPLNSAAQCRIGDAVNLRGVSMKMMLELNERFTDVTFRLLVIKSAKGDQPTRDNLYNGISGNKMIDVINTERYTVLFQKYIHLKTTGNGQIGAATETGIGNNSGTSVTSRATRIVKVWIPGTKFVKSGVLTYENASAQPKFFDYHVILYAYSNFSTNQDVYYVGRVNDFVSQMYFKDA